jgi:hypothetical protein
LAEPGFGAGRGGDACPGRLRPEHRDRALAVRDPLGRGGDQNRPRGAPQGARSLRRCVRQSARRRLCPAHRDGTRGQVGTRRPQIHLHGAELGHLQRLRPARRLHLHHPRLARVDGQRGRARLRSRPRNRPCHGAAHGRTHRAHQRRQYRRHDPVDRCGGPHRLGRGGQSRRPSFGRHRGHGAGQLQPRAGIRSRQARCALHGHARLRPRGSRRHARQARRGHKAGNAHRRPLARRGRSILDPPDPSAHRRSRARGAGIRPPGGAANRRQPEA